MWSTFYRWLAYFVTSTHVIWFQFLIGHKSDFDEGCLKLWVGHRTLPLRNFKASFQTIFFWKGTRVTSTSFSGIMINGLFKKLYVETLIWPAHYNCRKTVWIPFNFFSVKCLTGVFDIKWWGGRGELGIHFRSWTLADLSRAHIARWFIRVAAHIAALVRAGLQATRVCFMARSNIVQKIVYIQILSEKKSRLAEDNGITLFFFHESEIKAASYLKNLQTQSSKGIIKGQNNGKNLSQRKMKRCVNVICNQWLRQRDNYLLKITPISL